MRKIIPLILAMLLLCGCSSLLEGSQAHSVPHNAPNEDDSSDPVYLEVSNYEELQQAMHTLVADHQDEGVIRFSSYNGDIEQDLNNACIYITNDTAIGSYAVSYVGSSLNRFVSYYEATISIIYEKEVTEINSIVNVTYVNEIEPVIKNVLDNCLSSVAIRTSGDYVNIESFDTILNKVYYSDPQLIVSMPIMNVTEHTDSIGKGRIYEVTMEYQNSDEIMLGMRSAFKTILEQLSYELEDTDDKDYLLYQLCTYLAGRTEYTGSVTDEEFDQFALENTAYGALYRGEASSEGFAMAMKLLCDWYEIECQVVTGRYDNRIHAWNMINVDGDWYHFDITRLDNSASASLMRTDSKMDDNYSWDTTVYPVCDGDLNHTYLTGSGQTEPPAENPEPAAIPDEPMVSEPEESEETSTIPAE